MTALAEPAGSTLTRAAVAAPAAATPDLVSHPAPAAATASVLPSAGDSAASSGPAMSDVIAQLLVVGVAASAIVLVIGLGLVLLTGRTGYHETMSPQLILSPQGSIAFPDTIGQALHDALALRPFAIIEVGALLLIATPVFRVAASVFLFLAERDRLYASVTVAVLALLLVSIFRLG